MKKEKHSFLYLKHKKLKILNILSIFMICQTISAQKNFVTAGGEDFSINGSITYSIGQVIFQNTSFNNSFKLNVGVQIPFLEGFIAPVESNFKLDGYPNPTTDIFNLLIKEYQLQDLTFQLSTIDGKLIDTAKIEQELTVINMENYPSGIYVLNVIGLSVQGSIKIIKQ